MLVTECYIFTTVVLATRARARLALRPHAGGDPFLRKNVRSAAVPKSAPLYGPIF